MNRNDLPPHLRPMPRIDSARLIMLASARCIDAAIELDPEGNDITPDQWTEIRSRALTIAECIWGDDSRIRDCILASPIPTA